MTDTFLDKAKITVGTMDPVRWRPEPNCESLYPAPLEMELCPICASQCETYKREKEVKADGED